MFVRIDCFVERRERCCVAGSICATRPHSILGCNRRLRPWLSLLTVVAATMGASFLFTGMGDAQGGTEPTFTKNFEGGGLGKIERIAKDQYRCFVPGQQDEHGRNRQAN